LPNLKTSSERHLGPPPPVLFSGRVMGKISLKILTALTYGLPMQKVYGAQKVNSASVLLQKMTPRKNIQG
jgi:hypothetical protein